MVRSAALAMTTLAFALADPPSAAHEPSLAGVRLFYGPSPETAQVDIDALDRARRTIDMAAYVLTDRNVMDALGAAAKRGVKVRIYLDRNESARANGKATDALATLITTPGVSVRYKARGRDPMHLKTYLVDRRVLRTGSANFSVSGERYQDNDVVILESPALAGVFARNFEKMWARAGNQEASR
ncbi:MAG: phosphatidylserine synthase [Methylobacteriaceae bacterium]|nr:phosphatidylserine synthase [Methylobacteriaceae bacterium]